MCIIPLWFLIDLRKPSLIHRRYIQDQADWVPNSDTLCSVLRAVFGADEGDRNGVDCTSPEVNYPLSLLQP